MMVRVKTKGTTKLNEKLIVQREFLLISKTFRECVHINFHRNPLGGQIKNNKSYIFEKCCKQFLRNCNYWPRSTQILDNCEERFMKRLIFSDMFTLMINLIDWFGRHVKPSRVILCLVVKISRSLYFHICGYIYLNPPREQDTTQDQYSRGV